MYHLIQAEAIEPKVRLEICSRCWRRPRHSESLPPAVPRQCQPTCAIFQLLPALAKRAELIDPMSRVARACRKDDDRTLLPRRPRRRYRDISNVRPEARPHCGRIS